MIVTCPACETDYKLDAALLPENGRQVRCVSCHHLWRHYPDGHGEEIGNDAEEEAAQEEPEAEATTEETEDVPVEEGGDADSDDMMIGSAPEEGFEVVLRRAADSIAPGPSIPEAVMPADGMGDGADVFRPMGMSQIQFGVLTFLSCTFITLSAVFLAKGPITALWPPASLLYERIGFDVPAPGEGLRIGRLAAEIQVDKARRTLIIEGQLTNMTHEAQPYPSLLVVVESAYGAELKSWTLDNAGINPLAPGKSVPLKLTFENPPDGAADVEVKVIKP